MTIDTNSNTDALNTVSANIDAFLALPVYGLLSDVPNDLSLKLFIPSKDNTSVLSGTESQFRSIDVTFDFTLPDLIAMPDVDDYPDTVKGMKDFKEAMNAYKQEGKVYNDQIKSLSAKLIQYDITRKYQRLQRVCQFVKSHDVSMFDHQEELDLFDLSVTTRQKILAIYQSAFKANPKLLLTGSAIDLDITTCNLDSIQGIDNIITVKNTAPSASYGFMSRELLGQVIQAVKSDCNGITLLKIASRLDTHLGGSKNSTTILANLRMLHGFKPTKSKTKTA
jgi:hypothetical protein